MRLIRNVLPLLAAFLLIIQLGVAQTTTGSIYGTVADAGGSVIPHASVVATDVLTGFTAKVNANDAGEYVFPGLNPSTYVVSTSVTGFQSLRQQNIVLSANQNVHVNFSLVAGSVEQAITVDAVTTLVDTRESQLGETIDQERLSELPLNGRNAADFVTLVPGIGNYSTDTAGGSRLGFQFSTNSLPITANSYYLDGTYDTAFYQGGGDLLPNPDALQEFRLLTSNFDAEFGRTPGGALNVITKSGGLQYHGMAYEYLRNNLFNAKTYFTTSVASYKEHQFGGNIGGPIPFLPKGRAFSFLSYEHLLLHTPVVIGPTQIVTATALERMGNFSASAVKPTLPAGTNCGTTAAPVICPASLDPVAQNLLNFVPVEVNGATTEQSAPGNVAGNQGLARIDYQLTPTHQLEAMFFTSRALSALPNTAGNQIFSYGGMQAYENQVNTVLEDTWTISPTTLNNLRGYYSQNRYILSNLYTNHFYSNLGSQAAEGGIVNAPPYFSITGYWTMGTSGGGPSDISQLSWGLVDTANLTRGKHNLKFGGSYVWGKYAETGAAQAGGSFSFTGSVTHNALADFILGKAAQLVQNNDAYHRSHTYDPALFAQDDWQVTQRLSVNLGLRWEIFAPMSGDPTVGTFIPNQQSQVIPGAPLGLVYPGDSGVAPAVYNVSLDKFAPRIGFAYDVFGTGRTSLRGGYGIFYDLQTEVISSALTQQPFGLSVTTQLPPNLTCPYGGSVPPCPAGTPAGTDPFPFVYSPSNAKFTSGAAVFGTTPHGGELPYVEEYNLTLEQQLSKMWALRVGYVGNAQRKLYISHDENAPIYAPGASVTTAGINARRPYQPIPSTYTFAAINIVDPSQNGMYNSLQTTLRGSVGSRLNVLANYVWSKAIDYEGPFVAGNDINLNRGLATTDLRDSFAASVLYRLPDVNSWGLIAKEVLSGWQLNGDTFLQSGTPFTVTSGTDTNLDGTNNDRANLVGPAYTGSSSRAQKILSYINPSSFTTPTGPYGSEPRNALISPRVVLTNLSAFKSFQIHNDVKLQFRTEAFNAFNNVNLGTPQTNLKTLQSEQLTNSAQITSLHAGAAGQARQLQFALKLLF